MASLTTNLFEYPAMKTLKSVMLAVAITVCLVNTGNIMITCNACCHNSFIINDTLINNQTHIHVCLTASRSRQYPHLELMHLSNGSL